MVSLEEEGEREGRKEGGEGISSIIAEKEFQN
jgi:hypothetical protein